MANRILGSISDRGRSVVFVGKAPFSHGSCLRVKDSCRPNEPVGLNADFYTCFDNVSHPLVVTACTDRNYCINCNLDLLKCLLTYFMYNKI